MRILFGILFVLFSLPVYATCQGRMTNPIKDICWDCIFPLTIGGFKLIDGEESYDTVNPKDIFCTCEKPIPRVGIWVGFWEPVRLVDVVREPFCFVGLGGVKLDMSQNIVGPARGSFSTDASSIRSGNYQVHWYEYPALIWLELILFVTCMETGNFDLAMMTEFDPTWDDDLASLILSPEAALFGNPYAQAACAADCVAASSGVLPLDVLFWCAGCQGSLYPMSGSVGNVISPIQASVLLTERLTYKMHRMGLLWGTIGKKARCERYPMPIMKKSQYKTQMTYPVVAGKKGKALACHPYGRTSTLWESMKSFPEKGEDFGYLIWRKRNCCDF